MRRIIVVFFASLLAATAASLLLPVSPVYLPRTGCRPTQAVFASVSMQVSYRDAVAAMGCDGVLIRTDDYGQLQIKTYGWRGSGWPYEVFRLGFYNDTLQKVERISLMLGR